MDADNTTTCRWLPNLRTYDKFKELFAESVHENMEKI